jgi:hypothetical protein
VLAKEYDQQADQLEANGRAADHGATLREP